MKPLEVIVLRSQDIFSDSRVLRYEEWYKKMILRIELLVGIEGENNYKEKILNIIRA